MARAIKGFLRYGPLVLAALACAQGRLVAGLLEWDVSGLVPGGARSAVYLPLSFVLLGLLFLALLAEAAQERKLRALPWPPAAVWAFVILAGLSAAVAAVRPGGSASALGLAKELIQTIGLLLCGFMVFIRAAREERGAQRLVAVLLAAAAVNLLVAAGQAFAVPRGASHEALRHSNFLVGGLLGDANVLGVFVAMLVPLAVGLAWHERAAERRALWALLAVTALLVAVTAGAWLGMLAGACAAAALRGRAAPVATRTPLVAILAVTCLLPRQNASAALDSVAAYRPDPEEPGVLAPSTRYRRWGADLNLIRRGLRTGEAWLGVGPGQYNQRLGETALWPGKRPPQVTDDPALYDRGGANEPNSFAAYEVVAVESGLLGLAALLALLGTLLAAAARAHARAADAFGRGLAAGLFGAGIGLAAACVFSSFLVRGLSLVFVLLLALAKGLEKEKVRALAPAEEDRVSPSDEAG